MFNKDVEQSQQTPYIYIYIVLIMSDIGLLKNSVRSEYENDLTWNVIWYKDPSS